MRWLLFPGLVALFACAFLSGLGFSRAAVRKFLIESEDSTFDSWLARTRAKRELHAFAKRIRP